MHSADVYNYVRTPEVSSTVHAEMALILAPGLICQAYHIASSFRTTANGSVPGQPSWFRKHQTKGTVMGLIHETLVEL